MLWSKALVPERSEPRGSGGGQCGRSGRCWRLSGGKDPSQGAYARRSGAAPEAGWPLGSPWSSQAPPCYLPSVTLRQHLLLLLFPLGFVGSGQGFWAVALAADSVPQSCSQQQGRPSGVERKAAPSWCSLQTELGQKWQNEVEGLPHTSQWCQGHTHFPARKLCVTTGATRTHVALLQTRGCPSHREHQGGEGPHTCPPAPLPALRPAGLRRADCWHELLGAPHQVGWSRPLQTDSCLLPWLCHLSPGKHV